MANYFLKPMYENVFGEEFSNSFEKRLAMQKTIYLLQDLGLSVGSYNFMWYKHGPYSQALQNDILCLGSAAEIQVKFSDEAKLILNKFKTAIFKSDISYSLCDWLECLGSLHYIKDNLLSASASEDEVLKELLRRKPHLNNVEENKYALDTLNSLFE